MRVSSHAARALAAAMLAFALVIVAATSAFAAPAEPTMDLTTLRAKLDASPLDPLGRHHLGGYLNTVVQGSTITSIPLQVLAITGGETADSSLILFEANGALIDRYGGIVEGMSGSPVFLFDPAGDKLIGALSYGDMFTIGGTGLATPIGEMTRLEDKYPLQVQTLARPIRTLTGVVDRVIVSRNPSALAAEAKTGALVARPLSTFFVGGVPADSKIFASFKKDMAAHGVGVTAQNGLSGAPAVGDTGYQTDLVGGASVTALMSRGDLWVGSAGTVTYGTGNTVLAYGHPANWDGATSMYMTNAWVDGIWPSQYAPYKIVRPTAVRGAITQDRGTGIVGQLGLMPSETAITASVINTDTGESTTTAVYVPSKLLDDTDYYSALVPMAVYPAASRLLDVSMTGGSAVTTTTVVVSNGTHTYAVVQPNVIDDTYDIPDTLVYDAWDDVMSLQGVQSWGLEGLHVVSVNLEARVSLRHNSAQIAAVDVPGGIKTGVNHAIVSLLAYGQAATQTVEADFTVPNGVNTRGLLTASSAQDSSEFYDYLDDYSYSMPIRESISDIVKDLNSMQPNNVIDLTFQPYSAQTDGPSISPTPVDTMPKAIETSAVTTWALSGEAEAGTPVIHVRRSPSTVDYGGSVFLNGSIDGPDEVGKVSVYGQTAGTVGEKFLGYATVMYSSFSDGPIFMFSADGLRANTTLRVHLDASPDGEWTSADASTFVNVRAHVGLISSATKFSAGTRIKLTSAVLPNGTGGWITFQRWNSSRKHWYSIKGAKILTVRGVTRAVTSWKPGRGTHKIRAHYAGGSTNVASNSRTLTLVVN